MTQTKALKKAIAISGREINNNKLAWIWKGRSNITFFFFSLNRALQTKIQKA